MTHALQTVARAAWSLLPDSIVDQYEPEDIEEKALYCWKTRYYRNQVEAVCLGLFPYTQVISTVWSCVTEEETLLLAFAANLAASYILWNQHGDGPARLAKNALIAMADDDEDRAIELIERGADVHHKFGNCTYELNIFPLFPIRTYEAKPFDLLVWSAFYGCEDAFTLLMALEPRQESIDFALRAVATIPMATTLIAFGAPLNTADGHISVLYHQLGFITNTQNSNGSLIEEKLNLINFLIDEGCRLNANDPTPEVIRGALDQMREHYPDTSSINTLIAEISRKLSTDT